MLHSSITLKALVIGLLVSINTTLSFAQSGEGSDYAAHGALSLDAAIERALEADPRLQAGDYLVEASKGRTRQAGAFPNPEIVMEVENFAGTDNFQGLRQAEISGSFEQLVEIGGKRRLRIESARNRQNVVSEDREAIRRVVIARTTSDFFNVLGANARLSIATERVKNAERLLPALRRRVDVGASPDVDLSRGKIASDLARIERDRSSLEFSAAKSRLASNWGGSDGEIDNIVGSLNMPVSSLMPYENLLEGLESHPIVVRWDAFREQKQADYKLEKARRTPDLTLGAGLRQIRETNDTAFLFSVSVPIPVWNRNQGAIYEAGQLLAKSEADRLAAYQDLYRQLNGVYSNVQSSCGEAVRLQDVIVPSAAQNLTQIESGYSQGRFGVLDLLDASTVLANARSQQIDSLVRCRTGGAEIEYLTGANPFSNNTDMSTQEVKP